MYDLISVGNISIDFFFKGSSLTFENNRFQLAIGGKYFVDFFHESLGGGGANIAIGVAKHNLKTAVLGIVGENSFKELILHKLKSSNVDTNFIKIEDNYFNISSILLSNSGERSIINYETPHQQIIPSDKELERFLKARMVYLGNLPDVSFTEREKLLSFFRLNNIVTIANLGVKDCRRPENQIKNFLKFVDILIVNGHEFSEIIKTPYEHIIFNKSTFEKVNHLHNKLAIITDGEKGSYAYCNGDYYFQEAVKVKKIIDTTGCGDGYTAGFIAQYLRSPDIKKSMETAAHYAAHILSKVGAN